MSRNFKQTPREMYSIRLSILSLLPHDKTLKSVPINVPNGNQNVCDPVVSTLPCVNPYRSTGKIDVPDPQPQTLHQTKSGPIKRLDHYHFPQNCC